MSNEEESSFELLLKCPLCRASPVVNEMCPASCGSLEGLMTLIAAPATAGATATATATAAHGSDNDNHHHNGNLGDSSNNNKDALLLLQPPTGRLFGFQWSQGFVAPFLGVDEDAVRQALSAATTALNEFDNKNKKIDNNKNNHNVLVDLGCGDGRICRIAVQDGFVHWAVGYDLDPKLVHEARDLAKTQGLGGNNNNNHEKNENGGLCTFHVQDLFEVHDMTPFTIATVFLLPETLADPRLVRKLQVVLRGGGCIISFGWKIPALESSSSSKSSSSNNNKNNTIHNNNNNSKSWGLYRQNEPLTLNGSVEEYSGLVKQWYVYR